MARCGTLTSKQITVAADAHESTSAAGVWQRFGRELLTAPPARKLAMAERLSAVPDDDELIPVFAKALSRATRIYNQSEDEIARLVLGAVGRLLKEGKQVKASQVMAAILDTPPANVPGAPKYECQDFVTSSAMFRMFNGEHDVAMTLMRETSKLIESGMVASYPQFARRAPSPPEAAEVAAPVPAGRNTARPQGSFGGIERAAEDAKQSADRLSSPDAARGRGVVDTPIDGTWYSATATRDIKSARRVDPSPPFYERDGEVRILKDSRLSAKRVKPANQSTRWLEQDSGGYSGRRGSFFTSPKRQRGPIVQWPSLALRACEERAATPT